MLIPTVLWAQRKDKLYVTLDVQDVQADPKIVVDNDETEKVGKLTFDGVAVGAEGEKKEYSLSLTFYKEVNREESKVHISPRHIFLVLVKAEPGEHWPRLTKDSGRHLSHIKCDWDKWIDEDDEEEGKDQFDMSKLGAFNGLGGMGGMDMAGMDMDALGGGDDDDDSDDDEGLPDLEK